MSRKKKTSYGEMLRLMEETQKKMTQERQRMSGVMADALLDDDAAAKLGDYSDTDLRRIMSLLGVYIPTCITKLEAEKASKTVSSSASHQAPMVSVQQNMAAQQVASQNYKNTYN